MPVSAKYRFSKADRPSAAVIAGSKDTRDQIGQNVVDIDSDMQEAIAQAVERAMSNGASESTLSDWIEQLNIGLDPRSAMALDNFRQGLINQQLPQAQIDAFASDYEERLLANRADVIAATELKGAVERGKNAEWAQQQQDGRLSADAMRVWLADVDSCPICQELAQEAADVDGMFGGWCEGPPAHPNCGCETAVYEPEEFGIQKDNPSHQPGGQGSPKWGGQSGEFAGKDVGLKASDSAWAESQRIANAKIKASPRPTAAQKRKGMADLKRGIGHRNIKPKQADANIQRQKLLDEFGNGKQCVCPICGHMIVGVGAVSLDRIWGQPEGGRYIMANLVPAHLSCNTERNAERVMGTYKVSGHMPDKSRVRGT